MSKSVLILDTPSCCEMCRFVDYEPKCRCRMLSYKDAKINDRFTKLDNCPLRELPERKAVIGIDGAIGMKELELHGRQKGWNACIDKILDN